MTALPSGFEPLASGLQGRINQRRRRVQFGEGYVQTSPDGLNTDQVELTLDFHIYGDTDLNTLLDFLAGLDGDTVTYTLPNETSSHEYEVINTSVRYIDREHRFLSLELRRVY